VKVRIVVTVTVDSGKWAEEFLLAPGEVRDDVRMYLRSQITEDPNVIEHCTEVVIR
jgi:hypothetical protein